MPQTNHLDTSKISNPVLEMIKAAALGLSEVHPFYLALYNSLSDTVTALEFDSTDGIACFNQLRKQFANLAKQQAEAGEGYADSVIAAATCNEWMRLALMEVQNAQNN